jgi:hypothetical protein
MLQSNLKVAYRTAGNQSTQSLLVESDFLAIFKLLCSIHVNVPLASDLLLINPFQLEFWNLETV